MEKQRTTTTVELSSRTEDVRIRRISWPVWKLVKTRASDALTESPAFGQVLGSIFSAIGDLSELNEEGEGVDVTNTAVMGMVAQHITAEVAALAPEVIRSVMVAFDDMTEQVVDDALVDEVDVEDLPALDMITLRDAVVELNDFAGMLALEGNSIWRVVAGFTTPAKSDDGGEESR